MKFWRTVVFCVLFSAAVMISLYQTRLEKQVLTQSPDETHRSVLLGMKDTPVRLEILGRAAKSRVLFEREEGQWFLSFPVRYPADTPVVEGLVTGLRMASKRTRLRAEKEWDEYGLAKPELEVRLEVPKRRSETLCLGAPSPLGRAVFAKWESERGYFLLPAELKAAFLGSVYTFREKRVFRAPGAGIRKITIEMGKDTWQWKREDGEWYWLEPLSRFGQKISAESLEPVLAALQNLHIKAFLDDNKKSRAELGFFIIHDRIRVDSGFSGPETLCFGNEAPLESAYYGFREHEAPVFLVDRGKVIRLLDLLKDGDSYF